MRDVEAMLVTRLLQSSLIASLWGLAKAGHMSRTGSTCLVTPGGEGADDSQAILDAFGQCGQNGRIEFQNATYHIERVMNTTGLVNCTVDIKGTLLVSNWYANMAFAQLTRRAHLVGYRHQVLAQQQSTHWIPKPKFCLVLGRYKSPSTGIWVWYYRRKRTGELSLSVSLCCI
jgi:hypothetical protein